MGAKGPGEPAGHILVVERDMIVGISLAEDLLDKGFRVSGPFISSEDVLALLAADPPDAAIVDPALRDGTGMIAARALLARHIPFVVFTADGPREHDGLGLSPWIDKPASTERLLEALGLGGTPDARDREPDSAS